MFVVFFKSDICGGSGTIIVFIWDKKSLQNCLFFVVAVQSLMSDVVALEPTVGFSYH